ncbi:hypothetical protein I6F26_10495 [Ensifer sp. IC3342]|nr:hypothetical protein [Ensifer sp. BRP08]MCA1447008.1 hypothetical protein [Ensifer sp. IC3342]
MTDVRFFLVASGSATLERLNIALFASEIAHAKSMARRMIPPLSKADYFSFSVYESVSETEFTEIVSYRAKVSETQVEEIA